MQQVEERIGTRHYTKVIELEEEEVQRVQEAELRRRCVAVSLLQDYMMVPTSPSLMASANGVLEATDSENEAIWRKLGFDVIMLGDCHPFAAHSGTIQLIKQYIRRRT